MEELGGHSRAWRNWEKMPPWRSWEKTTARGSWAGGCRGRGTIVMLLKRMGTSAPEQHRRQGPAMPL